MRGSQVKTGPVDCIDMGEAVGFLLCAALGAALVRFAGAIVEGQQRVNDVLARWLPRPIGARTCGIRLRLGDLSLVVRGRREGRRCRSAGLLAT
jgi:hypothetical protein